MEDRVTTGFRRLVGIAEAGVRSARFAWKDTNSAGNAGSAASGVARVGNMRR